MQHIAPENRTQHPTILMLQWDVDGGRYGTRVRRWWRRFPRAFPSVDAIDAAIEAVIAWCER
jgi:hypothetical protein